MWQLLLHPILVWNGGKVSAGTWGDLSQLVESWRIVACSCWSQVDLGGRDETGVELRLKVAVVELVYVVPRSMLVVSVFLFVFVLCKITHLTAEPLAGGWFLAKGTIGSV